MCTLTHHYHVTETPKHHNIWRYKSNEMQIKLNYCQLKRYIFHTSGLLVTWPEFWAIGLSFLGLYSKFCIFHYLASSPTVGGGCPKLKIEISNNYKNGKNSEQLIAK